MLGQYMNSVGYGAYETDSGIGYAFNGLDGFGSLPTPVLNALFAAEKVKEGDFPLAGEFVGAKLSRGFQIIQDGEAYAIVAKGSDAVSGLVEGLTGGGVVGKLIGAAAGAVTDVAGELTNVRVPLPDKKTSVNQSTSVGGTLVYEPAGMNMLLIAAVVGVVLVLGLYFMTKK
jgi:hypothetical protein